MNLKWRRTGAAWTVATAMLIAAGCDITGEYETRFAATLKQAGQRAVFDQYLHAADTELKEGEAPIGVKLKIPNLFDNNSKSLAPTEARANPPFVRLPGLIYALERSLDDNANQFSPAYVYFAAVPKGDQKPEQVQAPIAQAIAAAIPGMAWSDATVATPTGGTISLKVIKANGPQDFDHAGTGGAVQKLDGRFALYFIDAANHYVLIGFRAPNAQADKYAWDARVDAALGTLVVAGPPAGAAPAGGAPAAGTPAGAGGGAAPTPAAGGNAPAASAPAGAAPAGAAPAGT